MKDTEPLPRFLTPEEVADLLRVSRHTVYNWLRPGQLPAIRIGKVWPSTPRGHRPAAGSGWLIQVLTRCTNSCGVDGGEVNRQSPVLKTEYC